jgi:glycosyltransferase involved in cell wall biosynthesis
MISHNVPNISYLGAIYDDFEINKIFKASDVFCIPGTNGLGLNQAMFWGLPCATLDVLHSPEIIYLENEKNGFIVKSQEELGYKLLSLLNNKKMYSEFSKHAKDTITKKADITVMFEGFMNAINIVSKD